MGRLKPGATYLYERVDGVTYAREFGADPSTRFEIGREYQPREVSGTLWGDIQCAAKVNPTLKDALDRVLEIYELSKVNER